MYAPFSKVIVPIDFSEHSLRALKVADTLVQPSKGTLHLVHVLESSPLQFYASMGVLGGGVVIPTVNGLPLDMDTLKADLEKELGALIKQTRGGPCTSEVRTGNAVDEILKAAKEQKASLIVLCTHGRTGLAHAAIGSVSERVVRMSPVPVFTTRAELPPE